MPRRRYASPEERRAAKNARRRARHISQLPRLWADRIVIGEPDECWAWDGPIHSSGYPFASKDGRVAKAHRHVASLFGPVTGPVHHVCENKTCVNPTHLLRTGSIAAHKIHHRSCDHDDRYVNPNNGKSYCRECKRQRRRRDRMV